MARRTFVFWVVHPDGSVNGTANPKLVEAMFNRGLGSAVLVSNLEVVADRGAGDRTFDSAAVVAELQRAGAAQRAAPRLIPGPPPPASPSEPVALIDAEVLDDKSPA